MNTHDRLTALYGPHAVLHRHRRSHTARPNPERPMKPTSKQIVNGCAGGQGRTAPEIVGSASTFGGALILAVGVVVLVAVLPRVVALVEWASR